MRSRSQSSSSSSSSSASSASSGSRHRYHAPKLPFALPYWRHSVIGASTTSPSSMSQPAPWAPNVFYPRGALVWYAGSVWRCEGPHTSGANAREPTESLHLWTPIGSTQMASPGPPPYSHQQHLASDGDRARATAQEQAIARNVNALRDELRGTHAWQTGGLGVLTYAEDADMERTRQGVWAEWVDGGSDEAWLAAARARGVAYARAGDAGGVRPLVRWTLVEAGMALPFDAMPIGVESGGEALYAARAYVGGGVHIGKCGEHFGTDRAHFPYGGGEQALSTFEVLCGASDAVRWVSFHGKPASQPGWQPVEGGRERNDGRAILVARAQIGGGVHPGKCLVNDNHACIPFGGAEQWVDPFEVLVYSGDRR